MTKWRDNTRQITTFSALFSLLMLVISIVCFIAGAYLASVVAIIALVLEWTVFAKDRSDS